MSQPSAVQQVAIISDIHGNVTAFEAVLRDIDARGIETILNLGDVVGKGPRGAESVAISQRRCQVTVRGNWDDFIPRSDVLDEAGHWWRDELSSEDLHWLQSLPNCHHLDLSGRRIRLVHASAAGEHVRLYRHHSDEEFDAMFENTEFTGDGDMPAVVGCGDIHVAYLEAHHSRMLFNAGSVGNSLDEPTASYVILEGVPDGVVADPFGLQFVRIPYDVEAEIEIARRRGMPAFEPYAIELRTAIYRGAHEARGLTLSNV